jgi:Fur family ferric uptake transcriptional regulator
LSARNTRQLDAIREALLTAARPLSPAEIHEAARTVVPSISLATVYRRVKQLCVDKIAAPISLPGQSPRYELCTAAAKHHHHFHCDACDRVFDLDGCPGGLAEGGFAAWAPPGFSIQRHDIVLYGICSNCK